MRSLDLQVGRCLVSVVHSRARSSMVQGCSTSSPQRRRYGCVCGAASCALGCKKKLGLHLLHGLMDTSLTLRRRNHTFPRTQPHHLPKHPSLAPLAELAPSSENSSQAFSYLPSPPLRVANMPSSKTEKVSPLERANTVPIPVSLIVQDRRRVHSWSEQLHIKSSGDSLQHPVTGGSNHLDQEPSAAPTVDPFAGLSVGPHQPPFPVEPEPTRNWIEPSFFPDPLTGYMEERMISFRPASSQNNVDCSFNDSHPYQRQPDVSLSRDGPLVSRNTLWYLWFNTAGPGATSIVPPNSENDESLENGADPQSSRSFPSRNSGALNTELQTQHMEYTPQALPLADAKQPPSAGVSATCVSCLW